MLQMFIELLHVFAANYLHHADNNKMLIFEVIVIT